MVNYVIRIDGRDEVIDMNFGNAPMTTRRCFRIHRNITTDFVVEIPIFMRETCGHGMPHVTT